MFTLSGPKYDYLNDPDQMYEAFSVHRRDEFNILKNLVFPKGSDYPDIPIDVGTLVGLCRGNIR